MIINTFGTAFTSYDVKAKQTTKEEISEEKVSFDDTISQTDEIENIVYHTTTQSDGSKPTIFTDPVSKKHVIASLENETLDKLKERFDPSELIEKDDGSIRLTGDAEAFVSGWFADIAYKRDFLEADKDHDGKLSDEENRNIKNDFNIGIEALTEVDRTGTEKLLYASETIEGSYGNNKTPNILANYREFNLAKSLDDELNTTIQVDTNFDGVMTLEEAYTTKGDVDAQNVILRHLDEFGITTIPSDIDTSDFNQLFSFMIDLFIQKDQKEQEKIMAKFYERIEQASEPTKDETIQVYTQEHLEHIKKLQENQKENTNEKLEVYS